MSLNSKEVNKNYFIDHLTTIEKLSHLPKVKANNKLENKTALGTASLRLILTQYASNVQTDQLPSDIHTTIEFSLIQTTLFKLIFDL
ncbi:hypothetical protein MTR_3g087015 [Medicago truncatula]|uniref:Uncharacterized protein n=1 Tax=Medicago truncatula TaxID=3880 RepID=A0A072V1Q8_MEDTR|nr:hypothetical protein MTR_3g087015 [Medicago truncatula]